MSNTKKKRKRNSAAYHTPAVFVDAARYTLGAIDLDASSSSRANETVKAARFYSEDESGLVYPWGGRVYVHPPSDLIEAFWRRSCEHALFGGTGAAVVYVGVSVDQLGSLQGCEPLDNGQSCPAPSDWPRVIVKQCIRWISSKTGEPRTITNQWTFFCLLGGGPVMRARFREQFGAFGRYEAPSRLPRPERNLTAEIVSALASHPPMSKKALATCIRARESDVRRTVDELVGANRVILDGKRWTLATHPNGRDASKAPSRSSGRGTKTTIGAHVTESPNILSPPAVLERVHKLGDIGLDPCSARRSQVRAHVEWYGHEYQDGLVCSWKGYGLVYCFPPSKYAAQWVRKIVAEARAEAEIVALLPCRMDASWLHDYVIPTADAICYWRGSLRAIGESRKTVTPRALCYWGPRADVFRDAFASAGSVVLRTNVHRPQSWTVVVSRLSPTGTWLKSCGRRSRIVKKYMDQFSEELRCANVKVGCPPATGVRHLEITRYGIQDTKPESLETGGQLLVELLIAQKLVSEAHGYTVSWHQYIERKHPRTEIRIECSRS